MPAPTLSTVSCGLAAALLALSGCTKSSSTPGSPYELANGRVMQDVVTVAADPSGGAPVVTSVTTYDVSERGRTTVIGSASGSGPGLAQAVVGAAVSSVGLVGAAAIAANANGCRSTVNASYVTNNNSAAGGGDVGDVDAVTAGGCNGRNFSVSN